MRKGFLGLVALLIVGLLGLWFILWRGIRGREMSDADKAELTQFMQEQDRKAQERLRAQIDENKQRMVRATELFVGPAAAARLRAC